MIFKPGVALFILFFFVQLIADLRLNGLNLFPYREVVVELALNLPFSRKLGEQ